MSERKAYISMPRHNGERYAKLMVEQFKQMNATLGKSRYYELFGTPERAARTLAGICESCKYGDCVTCGVPEWACYLHDYDTLLEWLRGDAE